MATNGGGDSRRCCSMENLKKSWEYHFSWSGLYISGLFFSHAFVEYGFTNYMILLVQGVTENPNFRKAAAISIGQDCVQGFLEGILIYMVDGRIKPFWMIAICQASLVMANVMLWKESPVTSVVRMYLLLVPLVLGAAGQGFIGIHLYDNIVRELNKEVKKQPRPVDTELVEGGQLQLGFNTESEDAPQIQLGLNDQPGVAVQVQLGPSTEPDGIQNDIDENKIDPEETPDEIQVIHETYNGTDQTKLNSGSEKDERLLKQINRRFLVWRIIGRGPGALIALWFVTNLSWKSTFKYSAIVSGGCLVVFVLTEFYLFHRNSRNQDNDSSGSSSRPNLDSCTTEKKTRKHDFRQVLKCFQRKQDCPKESTSANENLKQLLKLLPLWAPFIVFYVFEAAGDNFFIEQLDKLDYSIVTKLRVPNIEALFYAARKCVSFLASILSGFLIDKFTEERNKKETTKEETLEKHASAWLVRITLGFFIGFACCLVAWCVEYRRLFYIFKYQGYEVIPMSIAWLAPQFCLLGMTEGFIGEGIEDFFKKFFDVNPNDEVSMHCLEVAVTVFNCFVDATAKLLSVVFVLKFRNWIGDSIDSSRLDNYYLMLAFMVLGGSFLFLCVYNFYVSKMRVSEGEGEGEGGEIADKK